MHAEHLMSSEMRNKDLGKAKRGERGRFRCLKRVLSRKLTLCGGFVEKKDGEKKRVVLLREKPTYCLIHLSPKKDTQTDSKPI